MCGTGAHALFHQEKAGQAREASAGRETNRDSKRGEREKKRKDTKTEKAEFDTIVCWREMKKPNPTITVVQLTYCDSITVCIQRTA